MNEKRVRLMTKLAAFEEEHHGMIRQAGTYYRSDFVGVNLLKNILRGTAAFFIGLALWACYHSEELMEKLNTMDVMGLGRQILIAYGVLMILFLALSYVIYSIRFFQCEKKLQSYRLMLERLGKEYEQEETAGRPRRRSAERRSAERRSAGRRRRGSHI